MAITPTPFVQTISFQSTTSLFERIPNTSRETLTIISFRSKNLIFAPN